MTPVNVLWTLLTGTDKTSFRLLAMMFSCCCSNYDDVMYMCALDGVKSGAMPNTVPLSIDSDFFSCCYGRKSWTDFVMVRETLVI